MAPSKARGGKYARSKEAEFPVRVDFPVPAHGLGQALNEIWDWLAENLTRDAYFSMSAAGPRRYGEPPTSMHRVCMTSAEDAARLAAEFKHLAPIVGTR